MGSLLFDMRRVAEQFCWLVFLLSLVMMSFISQPYQSIPWMLLSAVFYTLCCLYILLLMLGADYNRRAVYNASWIILVALAGLAWMFAQSVIPYTSELRQALLGVSGAPDWFAPAAVISVDPARSRSLFLTYLLPFACMLICLAMLTDRTRMKALLICLMFVATIHALGAAIAKYQQFYLVDKAQLDGHFSAARGWFINRNHFAAFMVMCNFGIIALLLKRPRSDNQKVIGIFALLVGLATAGVLILSQSRGGLLSFALLAGLALFIVPAVPTNAKIILGGVNVKSRFLILLCLLMLALLGLLLFGQELLQRLLQGSFSLGERVLQWQITWQAIQQSPWLGYGAGTYAAVFQVFREYADLRQVVFDQSHNEYLHIWLEQGLPGLLLWLVFIGLVLKKSWRAYRKTRSSLVAAVLAAGVMVVIAALFQALVDFNLQIISLRCYFFVIIAAVLAAPGISQRNKHKT